MENNFIQMTASAGHAVACTIGNIFSKIFFYLKLQSFHLIMENNFIQMPASAGHTVTIGNIFSNFLFYLKVQSFRLIKENNFIQMAIGPIFKFAVVFHQWLHEYCPLKRQLSVACRLNTYL